jgi:5-methylcytosine-specific restriction endonuclease McrA
MRRVLLLNASHEPLTAISLKRAVVLVLADKAETIEFDANGTVLHSASLAVDAPAVIRLKYYVRVPYMNRVPLTRRALMRRDNYRCAYCQSRAETIDHVVPRSRGGEHIWENVVASCKAHNMRKANKLLSELGWALPFTPSVPREPRWLSGIEHVDPVWMPYLEDWAAA